MAGLKGGNMPTEAGKGEHHVYRIKQTGPGDQTKLTPGEHYLGIDAVAWFINKESSWFTDRMASGTLDIKLSSGLEKYQAALGTFELKGGSKVAPVFERPVLPDRNFIGGVITLAASLTAIKKDTVIGGMLKSAANASLGIVAGMVHTAAVSGPAKLLVAAGEDLIGGVKRVLSDTAEKREPLFDFSGLEFTIQPDLVIGPQNFLLFHRGAALNEADLTVREDGQLLLPFLKGAILDDGAWLLLRLRRSSEYSGVRDWYGSARALRGRLSALVDDVSSGVVTKEEAMKLFKPSSTGNTTIYDEFSKLRAVIFNDGVLSEREAKVHVGALAGAMRAAQEAIKKGDRNLFKEATTQMRMALLKGQPVRGIIGKVYEEQAIALVESRRQLLRKGKGKKAAARPPTGEIFAEARDLRKAVKMSTSF
jgi:hypothetical protein